MNITIFGGSLPQPGSEQYQEAYLLGNLLASAGHTVITGGYMGTMEAASKGAYDAGGNVIGITCQEIESWRKAKHNTWVKEEIRQNTLQERIHMLIKLCDAAVALPGGPGTLAEIMVMWNLVQIEAIPRKPILLVGTGWKNVMDSFFQNQNYYISSESKLILHFVSTINEVLAILPLPPSGS